MISEKSNCRKLTGTPLLYVLLIAWMLIPLHLNAEPPKTEEIQQSGEITITGKIIDDIGDELPGATVTVKGTSIGNITDLEGAYVIKAPSRESILVFSYMGMKTQEIQVGNNTIINVTLESDVSLLDEIIVVGYGTVSKKNLTTAISKISVDDVSNAANSNMSQMLLGRAAGLQATVASAQPGGNVNISIRGATGAPLYVVDGVVIPAEALQSSNGGLVTPNSVNRSGLAGLNPEDIESVEVLKDASASIYGIGASNGVILITTKKGKEGAMNINYQGSVSSVRNYDYPTSLNAQQYMNYVNIFTKERYLYDLNMVPYGDTPYDNGWIPSFSEQEIANARTTNWRDEIMQNGQITNHTLNISGGSNNLNYYVSGNYFDQEGSVKNSAMQRFSLRSAVSVNLLSFIKLSTNINLNYNKYNNSSVGGTTNGRGEEASGSLTAALMYPPHLPIYDGNGNYTAFLTVPNPVGMNEIEDKTNSYGTFLNFTGDFTIIKNMLTARLLYGNNMESARRSMYIPSNIYFDQKYMSRGNLGESRGINQTMQGLLMFNKSFFDIIDADVAIAMEKTINESNSMTTSYDGQHDAIRNDNISAATGVVTAYSGRAKDEKRAQLVRASFDILDKYVVSTTLRRDGTDKFFPDKKYSFFPSVSAAWKISNESFLKNIKWLNLLKVRGSYGTTGSDNLRARLYGTFGPDPHIVIFDGNSSKYTAIVSNGLDYPDVTWEKTIMKNVGLDFYLFRDRVSGSFDLFRNDIVDRLGSANTDPLSTYATRPINGSQHRRQGWDATINTKNIVQKDFTWSSVMTFTKYNSQWIKQMPNYIYNNYEKRGVVTTSSRYYYKTAGMINTDKSNMPESQKSLPAGAQKPGYPIIVDKNGDGEINKDDIYMDDLVPDIYMGFGNTFTYKGFDLDVFMYTQLGVEKNNYALDWAIPTNFSNQSSNANTYTDRIWNSQTNPNGSLPGMAYSLASVTLPEGVGTDIRYQDASFLRVRNITLGYNIKSNQLGLAGKVISNARVYIDAQNPLTFTKFEGFDPEVNTGGDYKGGKAEYPQTRTFSIGLKLTLK